MEAWLKILAGLVFFAFSLAYLYRPGWVLKANDWGRTIFFNDSFVLLYRRRWGLLFFAAGALFFFSGFLNLARETRDGPSGNYLDVSDAYRAYRGKEYKGAVKRCEEILKRDPKNVNAWVLMGWSWSALGNKAQARNAWARVRALDPAHSQSVEQGNPPALSPQR